MAIKSPQVIRPRQKLGKYRIEKRIARGPLASVYQAYDTIHCNRVALKIPHPDIDDPVLLEDFKKEVRLAFKLEHENILPVQNAGYVDGYFVIATPLGIGTLGDRLEKRMSLQTALEFADQVLASAAFAHSKRIIHCDIKPENYILFEDNHLRLGDFGFARRIIRSIKASGSGTLGYIAPEQAMGRPSFHSDVFSLGLILYRIFSGKLPEWPYEWPAVGHARLRTRLQPEFVEMIRRSIDLSPSGRYRDAVSLYAAFERLKHRTRKQAGGQRKKSRADALPSNWMAVRWKEFQKRFKKTLHTDYPCRKCKGPIAESMQHCPWCGEDDPAKKAESTFPAHCPRCNRGVKLDWDYCGWCYGPGFKKETNREFSDKRYMARCENASCERRLLMPFMRYCPWCKTKVRRRWKLAGTKHQCSKCSWGIAKDFWSFCAWCRHRVPRRHTS